jgi:CNT family concentrative nucleoside transporter
MERFVGLLGVGAILAICVLFSRNKKAIDWRMVSISIALQFVFALAMIGIPALNIEGPFYALFSGFNDGVLAIVAMSDEGAKFLFGDLIDSSKFGYIVAFRLLPTIIFFSSLMAVLYHFGVMQKIVRVIAIVMQKTLRISGAEALAAAAEIFVGQTESPLMIRPYVSKFTRSELLALMTGGMATVAGGVLAAYVSMLSEHIENIAGHLLTASIMAAPAALITAKILLPETEKPETLGSVPSAVESTHVNLLDAAAHGASEGTKLAINVGGMLIAFIALMALFNAILSSIGGAVGLEVLIGRPLSLELILGWVFAPLAWLMGISWSEAFIVGELLGKKLVINEFVAYFDLGQLKDTISPRSRIIASYALCGFANFGSIAIQLGGTGSLVPERRRDIARLGFRALLGGTLATCMTASIVGLLV